jgi:sugar lactone lactonase YvrE
VYVADAGRRLVRRYNRQGKLLNELAKRDEARGIDGLLVPSAHLDVAVDANGLVWIANPGRHRLEAYSPDGTLHRYWGAAGGAIDAFHGCCNPADFLLLADGSFITAEKGLARVKRYDADGILESVITSPTDFSESPRGLDVAADASGNVLVLERGTRVVRVYGRTQGGGR